MQIDNTLSPDELLEPIGRMWALSAEKIRSIERSCSPDSGTPVFTVDGRYTAQGWTEWTQGFQFGSAVLQFDATGDAEFLELGRNGTVERMASHVSHVGVHDHGFNNVSTYGNLRRLMREGRIPRDRRELELYELALKVSGAVQAARWTQTHDGDGFIFSFNGPHSLFSDTIRSLRVLGLAHALGHVLMAENDRPVSLLQRLIEHARTTARYNVYYGRGRDVYDVRGRVAHESIFNTNDGRYRCPGTQQGYSPFSTWTRGLAWIMLGYAEQLEFLRTLDDDALQPFGGREPITGMLLEAALASCDFYVEQTPADGIPYWDTGAPGLVHLGEYLNRPADPFNDYEPVDSSAAAIAAQGLLRLGRYLQAHGTQTPPGAAAAAQPDERRSPAISSSPAIQQSRAATGAPASGIPSSPAASVPTAAVPSRRADDYWQAGLTVLKTLLSEPYLSTAENHQGLLLHAVYHRPRGWDQVPAGANIPHGQSCLWGDYHLREAALYVGRVARGEPYYTFFGP